MRIGVFSFKMVKETKKEREENLKEIIEILERVIIILEDNPNITDVSKFYRGGDLVTDVYWIHNYIEEMVK